MKIGSPVRMPFAIRLAVLSFVAGATLLIAGQAGASMLPAPATPLPAAGLIPQAAPAPVQPVRMASLAAMDGSAAQLPAQPGAVNATFTPRLWLPSVKYQTRISTRLGFGASTDIAGYPELPSLLAGWYHNWGMNYTPVRPSGMEYVQTVYLHQKLNCADPYGPNGWDRTLCPYVVPYAYDLFYSLDYIRISAQANAGSIWLIGNEMDRRDWQWCDQPGVCHTGYQNEMMPEVYAQAYHDLYAFIKAADPSARIAIGGMIQATPLRMAYLTKIWDAYQSKYGGPMPVDVWNVHNFILKEDLNSWGASIPPGETAPNGQGVMYPDNDPQHMNMTIFNNQIRVFREWMKAHGQQDKPLIVTEYGVLLNHDTINGELRDPVAVQNFMLNTFDYFLYTTDCNLGDRSDGCRLVHSWAWFSADDDHYNPYTHLFDRTTKQITDTGRKFRAYSLLRVDDLRR